MSATLYPAASPHQPVDASQREHGGVQSPVMVLIVLLSTLGILVYSAFLLNPAHRGDLLPYALVIAAETVLVLHALVAMWTILSGTRDPRDFAYHQAKADLFGRSAVGAPTQWPLELGKRRISVDVFITVYGEDPDTVRHTVAGAMALQGRHRTWILDDGDSDAIRDLAIEFGARYVRRLSSGGAKAGNVNHALTLARGDFFAIFDADFIPHPDFLLETLPFMADPRVAFVQTPQVYRNLHTVIARGAGYMQTMFYRFIQPGRNRFNAAFCVGTNVLFRRTAVDEVGGIYTDSKSEDVWTSLMLHERGWKSVYTPAVLAVGEAPETIAAYAKQQLRWATGGFEILLKHNPFARARKLTTDQRIQYMVTATFYLTGICPLALILVPPLEIYFDLRPISTDLTPATWFMFYAAFYLVQVGLAWYAIGSFRWETLTLSIVSFPIYVKAFFNALRNRDVGWQATGSVRAASPHNFVVPQILFFVFLFLTSFVALWRDWDNGVATLATAWNITNTIILGIFLATARREARDLRRQRRLEKRAAKAANKNRPARTPVGPPPPVREPALVPVHAMSGTTSSHRTVVARPPFQPVHATPLPKRPTRTERGRS